MLVLELMLFELLFLFLPQAMAQTLGQSPCGFHGKQSSARKRDYMHGLVQEERTYPLGGTLGDEKYSTKERSSRYGEDELGFSSKALFGYTPRRLHHENRVTRGKKRANGILSPGAPTDAEH